MTDRELLEKAAKAAGVKVDWRESVGCFCCSGSPYDVAWNPLADDGDALRLALTLGLCIEPYPLYSPEKHSVIVKQRRRSDQMREANPTEVVEVFGTDATAATRRAIVRAAAAIGEQA